MQAIGSRNLSRSIFAFCMQQTASKCGACGLFLKVGRLFGCCYLPYYYPVAAFYCRNCANYLLLSCQMSLRLRASFLRPIVYVAARLE